MTRRGIAEAALAAWGEGELVRAEQLYREALAAPHEPGWESASDVEADLTLSLAGVLAAAHRDDEAQELFARAVGSMELNDSPLLPVGRYFRAEHLAHLERHEDVLEALGPLDARDGSYGAAKMLEALSLDALGRPGAEDAAADAVAHAKTGKQREKILRSLGRLSPRLR